MASGGQIKYTVGFNVDKTGLNELTKMLQNVQTELSKASSTSGVTSQIQTTIDAAKQLEGILNGAWNSKLNQLDLSKVSSGIKSTFGSVQQLKAQMEASGPAGAAAYNKVASAILNTNLQLKQSNKLLDEMATTMANTVKWGVTSSIFNRITGSIQEAWGYTKRLDGSLNDIRIVTDKSAESMQKFAKRANEAAKALGKGTVDFTDASLIYYQQGLSDEEVAARAETTLKAANVTGQSTEEVSEQLTAVWNGYKVSAQEAELYVDKLAAVAASTAADLEELSTGMSKVASAANSMGVDIDQLNAQLATIVSVTRQAPESVGTALKTIYARLGDLAIEGQDEFGVTLGTVSKQMQQMGIEILDSEGQMRQMGIVIEETAEKWKTWSSAQREAAAVAMAGKRQYNNLIALFDNWDMYTKSLNTSVDATGTLQKQQDIYMESTQAHLQKLTTEAEKTYDVLFDEEVVKDFIDSVTGALSLFNNFIEGVGGGEQAILTLGVLVANVFSKQIGGAVSTQLENLQKLKDAQDAEKIKQEIITAHSAKGQDVNNSAALEKEVEIAEKILHARENLTSEQYNELTAEQQKIGLLEQQIQNIEEIGKNSNQSYELRKRTLDRENKGLNENLQQYEQIQQSLKKIDSLNANQRKNKKEMLKEEKSLYSQVSDIIENRSTIEGDDIFSQDQLDRLEEIKDKLKDNIDILKKGGTITQKRKLTEKEEQEILEAQKLVIKAQTDYRDEIARQTKLQQQYEDGTLDKLKQEEEARQRIVEQSIRQAEEQKLISDAIQGITAIISLGSSLIGIFKTLSNEELSIEEKTEQILTVCMAMLPVIVQNFDAFSKIIPGVSAMVIKFANGLSTTTTAATTFGEALNAIKIAAKGALLPLLPYIAILAALGAAIWAVTKAYNADAEAAKKAAEEAKKATEAANEAAETYEKLVNTFEAYDTAVKKLQELTKGTNEYKDALKDANNQAIELIKTNKNLAKYVKRDEKGLITFEGADSEIQVAKTRADLANSTANLFQITANKTKLESDITNKTREIEDSFGTFGYLNKNWIKDIIAEINDKELDALGIAEITGSQNELLISSLQELAEETANLNATNKLLREDALRKSLGANTDYAEMSAEEQEVVASLYGEGLTDAEIENLREEAKKGFYNDYIFGFGNEDEIQQLYAEKRGWTLSENKIGDKAVYIDAEGNEHTVSDESAATYLVEQKVADDIGKYNEEKLNSLINTTNKFSEGIAGIDNEKITNELFDFARGDKSIDANSIDLNTFNELEQMTKNGKLAENFNLSDQEWEELKYKDAEDFSNSVSNALTASLKETLIKSAKEAVVGASEDINTLILDFQNGDITAESLIKNENYQNLLNQLDNLTALYPELQDEAIAFADTNLVGTQMWSEALYEINEAINNLSLEEKVEDFKKVWGQISKYNWEVTDQEVDLFLNSEDFEEKLDALMSADYAINVEIHAQAEDAFESTQNSIDKIKEEASKIGENYIVAAEDIRELNQVFPGILSNATDLRNGTIQLNEDILKSAISTAQGEAIADAEKTNKLLEDSANELRSKQANYQAMADAAEALKEGELKGEEVSADTKAIIQDGLNTMYKESTDANLEDQEKIATNAGENAEIMATNWANAYEQAALQAQKFAQDAVEAAKVAQAGEGNVILSDYGVNYTGQTGVSSEATQLDKYQGMLDSGKAEQYEALRAAFQNAADAAGKQANDIEGMMIETGAILEHFTFGSLGIVAGQGFTDISDSADDANEKTADVADTLESIYDRYREINNQLAILDTNLGRIQKRQEKLTGKAYIQNLEQQLDILNKQIDANKTKLSITEQEMSEVIAALAMHGAKFNEQGQVTNYKEVVDQALANANAVINNYNSMSAAQQEAYKATMESSTESYEALLKTFERFDELYTEEIPGLVDTIQEALDQAVELKIEQFNTKIQIDLDLKQAEREWNDFQANVLKGLKEEDLVGQANLGITQWDTYYGKNGTNTISTDIAKLEELNKQASQMLNGKFGSIYGDNFAKLHEDMKAATQQLMTDMQAAQEVADGIYNNYLESIDKVVEGNDAVIEQYEYINGLLDHNVKLIELIGANESSSMLAEQYAQRNALNQQMVLEHLENARYYEEMMNSIDDKTSEEWRKWHDAWQSEVESLNGSIITAMEDAAEAYAGAIDLALQKMESAFTDGMGFEYIQDEWDLVNENADKYLDTINAAYEISSLENKFVEAINNTDNLAAQKKLQTAMEQEIKLLEEAEQISQYDIDRANLKYELTLKQIALEEAQANKNVMKLRRDSQGNYNYVFTADQDEIAKAQQELADAQNELYNFDKDAYKEKTEAVLKAEQDLKSKLEEIWTNENLSEEQKLQYATMINKQYRDIIEAETLESEKTKQNLSADTLDILIANFDKEKKVALDTGAAEDEANRIAVENMQDRFKGLTNESIPTLEELSKKWGDGTAIGTITGDMNEGTKRLVKNIQDNFNTGMSGITSKFAGRSGDPDNPSFVEAIEKAMKDCETASTDFQSVINNVAIAAGVDIEALKSKTDNLKGSTNNLKEVLLLLIATNDNYITKVSGEGGSLSVAQDLADAYKTQHDNVKDINDQMSTYIDYLTRMKERAEAAAKAANELTAAVKNQADAQNKGSISGPSGVGGGPSGNLNAATPNTGGGSGSSITNQSQTDTRSAEEKAGGKYGTWTAHYDAKGAKDNVYPPQTYTGWAYRVGSASGTYPIGIAKRPGGTRFGWVSGFDTGGYTGEWGSDGKLAMLHEKEIVLNKMDTKNILDVVSMVREMTSSSLRGANGMISGMMETLASIVNNSNNTSQTVHITAEFPNVKVASEIEEAFNSLTNIASQHAFQY